MSKSWEATLRKTQAAAKKRAHSIFGSMSVAHANDDFPDDGSQEDGSSHSGSEHSLSTEPAQVEKFLPNGDYYMGQWSENCPHGHGRYLWIDGCMYVGEWFRGQSIGKGRFSWPSGAIYEGEFKSGYMDGKGTYTGPNGEMYRGFWVMNMKHGHGSMHYKTGDLYEGEWRHGVQEGQGRYEWCNGNQYIGEWRNGMVNGPGIMVWANGNYFEGNWVDGLPKGEGIFKWPDGSYYEGNWSNDPKEMTGTFHPASESEGEVSTWDPQELYKEIQDECKLCPIEKISVYPSQKKLAAWRSQKNTEPKIRPGRMSVDSRISPTGGLWDNDASLAPEINQRLSVGGRDVDLEVLNLENYASKINAPGTPGRPLKIPKVGKKPGEVITKGHKNYDLMLNLQLGIRYFDKGLVHLCDIQPTIYINCIDYVALLCSPLIVYSRYIGDIICLDGVQFKIEWPSFSSRISYGSNTLVGLTNSMQLNYVKSSLKHSYLLAPFQEPDAPHSRLIVLMPTIMNMWELVQACCWKTCSADKP